MKHLLLGVVLSTVFGGTNVAIEPIEYVSTQETEAVLTVEEAWTKDRIKEEIRKTFPEQPDLMVKVAECESSLIPTAHNTTLNKNGTTDGGLFQINSIHKVDGDIFDPATNIQYARKLYDERGTKPWNGSKHCWSQ